ncbi:disintegrin and metalloproteinase domain-containing protein 19-like [Neofelis nebulosa]|uniref:disintegrin and metalloproteinase domain-containing protein 19-like n=1 Tax=Neofelis nebulosa TaxID=61452 RepID=UPI00272DC78D|nr:disintegrin and metalloproteinase domain-containing protein 19-like [Neofelis nebulosa]
MQLEDASLPQAVRQSGEPERNGPAGGWPPGPCLSEQRKEPGGRDRLLPHGSSAASPELGFLVPASCPLPPHFQALTARALNFSRTTPGYQAPDDPVPGCPLSPPPLGPRHSRPPAFFLLPLPGAGFG